jgi:hypothetical protein
VREDRRIALCLLFFLRHLPQKKRKKERKKERKKARKKKLNSFLGGKFF